MIMKYLVERRSWIVFYAVMHVFIGFVAYVDSSIPLNSIVYLLFLSFIAFITFLIVRYNVETAYFMRLEQRDNNLDLSSLPIADSPFEEIIGESITKQVELLKQDASQQQVAIEQEKDDLFAWVHEVKTPLTAMRLIIERTDDERLKSDLIYEWLRIHHLLDQQLHQSRISFIENDLYIEHIELQSLIFNEIKTLQSWCIQKGIGFDTDFEVEEVLSDAKWLAFILRQLLSNAVKYSPASEIQIRSYRRADHIVLEVKDEGRGIDAKDLPRIFEKGFTSTSMHKDSAATGMGLYLANKAAKSLLIRIDVTSQLGAGTTFALTFPKPNAFNRMTSV